MNKTEKHEKLYEAIVFEIARLSMIISNGVPKEESMGLAMLINHLSAIAFHWYYNKITTDFTVEKVS